MPEKLVVVKVGYGLAMLTTSIAVGQEFGCSEEASAALGFPAYDCVGEMAYIALEEGRKRFEVAGVVFDII